jgi:hypothetical protein
MLGHKSGRIITFYSYKAGAGRTMAVANVAWILASNGYNVLLIDWDLESPGLHRYLRPFLADPELTNTPGVIDFACELTRPRSINTPRGEAHPSLMNHIVRVNWTFPAAGSIDFLAAGRNDANYERRVNTFNWHEFSERLHGDRLFEAERNNLRAKYDYVLIDSRTGVSDTSGICTVQMPDLLVVFFTLNHQSIEGAAAAAASIQAKRAELPIFPVPTRIEYGEQDKLSAGLAYARQLFAPFLLHVQSNQRAIDPSEQASYWRDVETPYVAFYAFEEIPAAFKDEPGSPRGLLAANERLSFWITDRIVRSLKLEGEQHQKAVLQAYAFNQGWSVGFDRASPTGKNPLLGKAVQIARRWGRHGWQAATAVLAVGLLLIAGMVWHNNEVRSKQMAILAAQLAEAVQELRKVQTFVSGTSASSNFPQTEFNEALAALQSVRKQMQPTDQIPSDSAPQGGLTREQPSH